MGLLIIVVLFTIYFALLFSESNVAKSVKSWYYTRRMEEAFNEPLIRNHKTVHFWEKGDQLVYRKTMSINSPCKLLTFSSSKVIAEDEYSGQKLVLPGKYIVENKSAELRQAFHESQRYQKNVLPEIKNDLKQLN